MNEPGTVSSTPLPSFGKIAVALAKAQVAFPTLTRSKTVTIKSQKGTFKYAYTPLDKIVEAVRKPLSDNGLAFVQVTRFEHGKLWLATVLLHDSGQTIESVYPLPDKTGDPQAFGSALTYAKRYSLSALLGLVTEDDDDGARSTSEAVISPAHVKSLKAEMDKLGKTGEDVKALCRSVSGQSNVRKLTPAQFDQVFKALSARTLADAGDGRGGKK
jgi:hypothetical protein